MLAGYVTYEELKIITGFNEIFLNKLITKGLSRHEVDLEYDNFNKPQRVTNYKQTLFNLNEVEEWLKVHVF